MGREIRASANIRIQEHECSEKVYPCPKCGNLSMRHSTDVRWIRDAAPDKTLVLKVRVSKHFCEQCKKYFTKPTNFAPPSSRFSHRVHDIAVNLVLGDNLTLAQARSRLAAEHHVSVPTTTMYEWVKEAKCRKKRSPQSGSPG